MYKQHYEKFADGTIKNIENEIPFEIPDTWCWCRLKDLGDIVAGGTPDTKNSDYWNVYYYLLNEIKIAFDENGIEIPFNQLDVNVKQN